MCHASELHVVMHYTAALNYAGYLVEDRYSPQCSHPAEGALQAQPSFLCSCTWQRCTGLPAPITKRGDVSLSADSEGNAYISTNVLIFQINSELNSAYLHLLENTAGLTVKMMMNYI